MKGKLALQAIGVNCILHTPFLLSHRASHNTVLFWKLISITLAIITSKSFIIMPPRKKAAVANPTRASSRIKSATQPVISQPATTSKPKSKRGYESESEDDTYNSKPVSKKAKKTKEQDVDAQDDQAVDATTSSQPPPDEPKKMVTDTSICCRVIKFLALIRSLQSRGEQRPWILHPGSLVRA